MGNNEHLPGMEIFFGDIHQEGIPFAGIKEKGERKNRKPRLKLINRNQLILRSMDIDTLVGEDHDVRAIWELIGRLDLSKYYKDIESVEGESGRPAFDPQLLISIWIYSYSKGISSAREISRLCNYDPAYQWLTGMEEINYHTLSDFRVLYRDGLNGLFIEILGVLSSEGLVTLERVMHDGTKVKANVSRDTFRREGRIRAHLEVAKEQVNLMEEMSEEEITPRVARARERVVREKKELLELALKELEKIRVIKGTKEEKEEVRVSITEPESRHMKQSDGGYAPSYNVQISTDAKEKIIVGVDVSQSGSDYEELVPAMEKVKENMGCEPSQGVVDGGFISRENILAMKEKEIDLIGPMDDRHSQSAGQMKRRGIDPAFHYEAFKYDKKSDTYICPADKILRYEGKESRKGKTNYKYRASACECQVCSLKQKCCPQNEKRGRGIVRGIDDPVVIAFKEKMKTEESKVIYKQRGAVAEFPNAWLKEKIGLRRFRLQGLIKAGIEALWACLTYNIKQWIRLCWRIQRA
ncbi:MAG: IS1182 family transposase [Candidatus Desantisbacteria bacterium]